MQIIAYSYNSDSSHKTIAGCAVCCSVCFRHDMHGVCLLCVCGVVVELCVCFAVRFSVFPCVVRCVVRGGVCVTSGSLYAGLLPAVSARVPLGYPECL